MRRWLIVLVVILATLGITNLLYPWTGTNMQIGIYLRFPPSADIITNDTDILQMPVKVGAMQGDSASGVDYGTYYLVTDLDSDSTVDTDEWTARTQLPLNHVIDDINQDTPFVLGWLNSTRLTSGNAYFIIGVVKNISGIYSCDLTKIIGTGVNGTTGAGDSLITDSAIRRFTAQGRRP